MYLNFNLFQTVTATEQIFVLSGDVIGIDYPTGQDGGVIPYEHFKSGADPSTLTAGVTEESLSTVVNKNIQNGDLPIGVVINNNVESFKRIPALKPIFLCKETIVSIYTIYNH